VFKLTIEDDEGKTTVIPLIRDEMTIGRQDGNTIRLTERNISRKHARLVRQNGTMYVEDLASYTGVRVNGARIVAMTPVAEGDEVQIGDYKLMVRLDRPAVAVNPDRATMPAMPAALGPMNSPGGSVAIPTRGTPAMAAQAAPGQTRQSPVVAQEVARVSAPAPVVRQSAPVPHSASAVPDPLEAQPTIPVRTLAEAPQGPQAAAQTNARLVVLTSELAGQEFSLARASVVIGRTEENDIVINHRSISRHHAKIVREVDRYTIVDLQSANGVRVNNEDYERIELHPGDVVELGHVKLRFVGPFEHYVFDPNVKHDRPAFPMKMVAGAGALVVVAGIAVFVLRGAHGPEPIAAPASVAAAPTPVAATPPAAPANTLPAAPSGPTPQALLADATRAAGSEDWAAARAALDKLPASSGDATVDKQAGDLGKRVDVELHAAASFAQLGEAATARKYADAIARYGEIPAGSVYKARGKARADEARSLLVAERLADAEKARAAGRCGDVRDAADEILELDPKNTLAGQLVRMCKSKPEPAARPARTRAVAAAAPAARERQPEKPERAEAPAAAEPEVDADFLMKQAREAWLRQQCGSAIELSRKALKAKPGMSDAYQIIAVCSCSLKDVDGATRAYGKLDEKNRNLVHSLCAKNGVIVGGEAQ
jgi:pSer/pThr/pTyr-binding forkhead associated (FHA) protein